MAAKNNSDEITYLQENGIRLRLLLEKMEKALRGQLKTKFTIDDPNEFYKELNKLRPQIEELQKKKRISKEQFELLLPSFECKSYVENYDISLIMQLLYGFCGFNHTVKKGCSTKTEENIKAIKKYRDAIQHGPLSITDKEFDAIYIAVKQNLIDIGCSKEDVESIRTIKVIDSDSKKKIKKLNKSSTGPFNYKYIPPVSNFIGREKEVQEIHKKLKEYNDNIHMSNPVYGLVIAGMSGVGKTELVRKYWLEYGQTYYTNSIVWINAQNKELIENSFLEVAEQAGLSIKMDGKYEPISKVISNVYCQFTQRKSNEPQCNRVLFVFDNLNNPAEMQDYLPSTIHYSPYILVTSQSKSWDTRFEIFDLNVLPEDTAHLFFEKNLASNKKDSNNAIDLLLSEIEYHPLAMQQSVAYINTNGITVNEYIDLLKERSKDLLMDDTTYNFNCQSAYKTICLSLKSLANKKDVAAETLFHTMAYLDGKNIKKGFLLKFCNEDKIILNRSLTLLKDLSLINIQKSDGTAEFEEQSVTIHVLIQKVLKWENAVQRNETLNLIFSKIFSDLKTALTHQSYDKAGKHWFNNFVYLFNQKEEDTRSNLITSLSSIPLNQFKSLMCIFESIKEYYLAEGFSDDSREITTALFYTSTTLIMLGQYKEALKLLRRVEESQMQMFGPKHPNLLNTQNNIARALFQIGEHQNAIKLFKAVIEKQLKVLGSEHPDLLVTQNNFADALSRKGAVSEALKLFKIVEEKKLKVLGPEHPDLLLTQHNIAATHSSLGEYQEATKLFKAVIEKQLKVLGPEHPDLLTTQHSIASEFLNRGEYCEALKLLKIVEKTRIKILGPEHPHLLATQNNIASAHSNLKEHQEAIKLWKSVEEKQLKVLGPEHPDLLTTQQNIASEFLDRGEYRKALELLKIVEEKQLKLFDPEHPGLLVTQNNIASAHLNLEEHQEAIKLLKSVEEKQLKILGPEHPDLLKTQNNIAFTHIDLGEYQEAIKVSTKLEETLQKTVDSKNLFLLKTHFNMGVKLHKLGEWQKALTMLKKTEEIQLKVLGPAHPDLLATRNFIAQINTFIHKCSQIFTQLSVQLSMNNTHR